MRVSPLLNVETDGQLVRRPGQVIVLLLLPLPPPVVKSAPVPLTRDGEVLLAKTQRAVLVAALAASRMKNCADREDAHDEADEIELHRLSATQLLVDARCWVGAYNTGEANRVVNFARPFAPRLVTDSASDYSDGIISRPRGGWGWATATRSKSGCRMAARLPGSTRVRRACVEGLQRAARGRCRPSLPRWTISASGGKARLWALSNCA
jgi:hypothetical protein